MKRGLNLIAAGFALTALSYGLARFAYGLLLPQIREDLALGVTAAGWIGGSAFAAHCVGILLAFYGIGKLGARFIAVAAGLAAMIGMGLASFSSSGWTLALGIGSAGLSTGLTSPSLATAIAARFNDHDSPKANGMINAGTAAGIMFSGMAALVAAGAWRELYALFALIGAGISVWLWFAVPSGGRGQAASTLSFAILARPGVPALCASAALMGMASAAIWTFGADILRDDFQSEADCLAWVWIVVGASGISGSLTGVLTNRFGTARVHGCALLGIALGTLGLAATALSPVLAFAAMGVFGAAYIVSTAAFLIQGIKLLSDRPELGLGIPFLSLALGQAVGTPLFAAAMNAIGLLSALAIFAAAACVGIFIRPRNKTYANPSRTAAHR